MDDRTYVSGKMVRSAAAMVVIDLRPTVIEVQDDSEKSKRCLDDERRLDNKVR